MVASSLTPQTQAQKNMDASFNKLRILKMSLENRLEEFPTLAKSLQGGEQNGDARPPVLPRPAQLTGTVDLKLHGVEGLLDLYTLRQVTSDMEFKSSLNSPPRTYSTSQVRVQNYIQCLFMHTLNRSGAKFLFNAHQNSNEYR